MRTAGLSAAFASTPAASIGKTACVETVTIVTIGGMPPSLHDLLRTMLRIRAFEDAAEAASQGGVAAFGQSTGGSATVRGPLHLSTGQEAVAAGVCAHLRRTDLLTSTHRGHGHTIAKGADTARMMAELFGRATGFNGGKGGSMHIADFSVGMLGANGVVAAGLPIAVGAAQSLVLQARDAIVACFFGDGAINRGPFAEALNWAQVYGLPVLFVCEDNRWSATTPTGPLTAGEGAAARARAMGLPAVTVDGNDVLAVSEAAAACIAAVRACQGPRLLHAVTYRVKGHVSVDPATYRNPAELQQALATDPIESAIRRWYAAGARDADVQALRDAAEAEIAAAVAAAQAAPGPDRSAAYTDVQTVGEGRWF
jgi:acetoin:2,6-dichlorophenolindophenol oxidoreductase subunit alpha